MRPSSEMRDFVIAYCHDIGAGDDSLVERISAGPDTIMIGSDPDEFIAGGPQVRAILRRQVREMEGIKIHIEDVWAFEEGRIGWAVFSANAVPPGSDSSIKARGTLICRREAGAWKIVHLHSSIGVSNRDVIGRDLTTSIDEVADLVEDERPNLGQVASSEGTLTIMFTDIEGSTATNETLGDDSFLPILLKHNEIIRACAESAGGTIVKSQGDGFMIAFASARRGVECAIAVQRDVRVLDDRIKIRMGLHTGEPVRQADDFYGRDVAYAARIGSAANGGEILVSSLVRSLVEPSGTVAFVDSRRLELKGFDGLQDVHVVDW